MNLQVAMLRRIHKSWTKVTLACRASFSNGVKRASDLLLAGLLLAVMAPASLAERIMPRKRSRKTPASNLLAPLWSVLRGDMSLVGPRPAFASGHAGWVRTSVRPGLVCTWWIRRRASIDYGTEFAADSDYVESQGPLADLGILLRAAWTVLFGNSLASNPAPGEVPMLGVRIDNLTLPEAVSGILSGPAPDPNGGCRVRQISFVNPHCLNLACGNPDYRAILNASDLVLADGVGLQMAARWLGRPMRQNVNGTDLFPELCKVMEQRGLRLYLLGAQPGVAERVAAWVRQRFPALPLAGWRDGFFAEQEEAAVLSDIANARTDVLLVALGVPRQERWIHRNLSRLGPNVRCAAGVGGLFDFYSGRIPRAPLWMREAGLEWSFRLYQEPGRLWRRYLIGNFVFLAHILGHLLKERRSQSAV